MVQPLLLRIGPFLVRWLKRSVKDLAYCRKWYKMMAAESSGFPASDAFMYPLTSLIGERGDQYQWNG